MRNETKTTTHYDEQKPYEQQRLQSAPDDTNHFCAVRQHASGWWEGLVVYADTQMTLARTKKQYRHAADAYRQAARLLKAIANGTKGTR